MSTKKSGGSSKNLRDSKPKYLGIKRTAGQIVKAGQVIVRQRGTKIDAGKNVKVAKDHTLFATEEGIVHFRDVRKTKFNGHTIKKKLAEVIAAA